MFIDRKRMRVLFQIAFTKSGVSLLVTICFFSRNRKSAHFSLTTSLLMIKALIHCVLGEGLTPVAATSTMLLHGGERE